jgi:anti-anti-sigma factor
MDLFQVDATDTGDLMLRGELDAASVDLVRELAEAYPDRDPLVLDLSQLTFLDAAGFSAVASIATARPRRPVVLRRPRPNVARVLGLLAATRPRNLSLELAPAAVRVASPGVRTRSAALPRIARARAEMNARLRAAVGRIFSPTALAGRLGQVIRTARRQRRVRSARQP